MLTCLMADVKSLSLSVGIWLPSAVRLSSAASGFFPGVRAPPAGSRVESSRPRAPPSSWASMTHSGHYGTSSLPPSTGRSRGLPGVTGTINRCPKKQNKVTFCILS